LAAAARHGADLHFEETVLAWKARADGKGVWVKTSRGEYEAGQLVISAGPWAPSLLAECGLPLEVERQVLYWLEPRCGIAGFLPERFPIFVWEMESGVQPYGFPAIDGPDGGVKVAFYRTPVSQMCAPDTVDRIVGAKEIRAMQGAISQLIPDLSGRCKSAATCMYTNTPDKNFIVGRHPWHEQVVIACGFSGHGFKFCSVIGEAVADLIRKNSSGFDLGFFSPSRFSSSGFSAMSYDLSP